MCVCVCVYNYYRVGQCHFMTMNYKQQQIKKNKKKSNPNCFAISHARWLPFVVVKRQIGLRFYKFHGTFYASIFGIAQTFFDNLRKVWRICNMIIFNCFGRFFWNDVCRCGLEDVVFFSKGLTSVIFNFDSWAIHALWIYARIKNWR